MTPIQYFKQFGRCLVICKESKEANERIAAAYTILAVADRIVKAGYHARLQRFFELGANNPGKRSEEREKYSTWDKLVRRSLELVITAAERRVEYFQHFELLYMMVNFYQNVDDEVERTELKVHIDRAAENEGTKAMFERLTNGAEGITSFDSIAIIVEQFDQESDLLKEEMPELN